MGNLASCIVTYSGEKLCFQFFYICTPPVLSNKCPVHLSPVVFINLYTHSKTRGTKGRNVRPTVVLGDERALTPS